MKMSDIRRFKLLLSRAKRDGKTEFTFDGQHVSVTYGEYLVQYLERKAMPVREVEGC